MSQCGTRALRGRPPTSSLESKILQGKNSNSQLKCPICERVFPRNKSLQAHLRTHTGEMPYACDYPSCERVFKQSGHLRSHKYRHSGEKPFCCPKEGCTERYVHSNRNCSRHKTLKLVRDGKETIRTDWENLDESRIEWLRKYQDQQTKSKSRKGQKRKRSSSNHLNNMECSDQHNLSENGLPAEMNNNENKRFCSILTHAPDTNQSTLHAVDTIDSRLEKTKLSESSETPSTVSDFNTENLSCIFKLGIDIEYAAKVLLEMKYNANISFNSKVP